jgi:hypothetical protein
MGITSCFFRKREKVLRIVTEWMRALSKPPSAPG